MNPPCLLLQFLFVSFLFSKGLVAQSTPEYYTAAVYEHVRLGKLSDDPNERIRSNLNMYERAVEVAASKGADIIVFPEYGIFAPLNRTTLKPFLEQTPDPRVDSSNPCEQKDEFSNRPILYTLSCLAKKHRMVLVANTGDIQPCIQRNDSKCPDDGVHHFNTLVAFDRDGTLISRYHKAHLFYEFGMDVPEEPQSPIFETDFGTFAMFICFDYIFEDIVKAAEQVDNIILSSMWIDRMPLSNSVQFYEAWALGNKVTYLASNIQIPGYGSVGSGIFSGYSGAIEYTHNPDGLSKLVVSNVPKSKHERGPFLNLNSSITVITQNDTKEHHDDGKDVPEECSVLVVGEPQDLLKDYRCWVESLANYTLIKLTKLSDDLEACNDGMCCSLRYTASSMNETYFFGVLNGTHNLTNRYSWCEENCIVVRCDAFNETECVTFPTRSTTVFNKIEIKANFTTEFVYPSIVQSALRLAPKNEWSHSLEKQADQIKGSLEFESHSLEPLLVASLNGRCYDRDPPYVR